MRLRPVQEWWTTDQIAAAGLPDMAATRQGVEAQAARDNWRSHPVHARRRAGKGGGWEYSWALFPDRAKRKLLAEVRAPKEPVRPARDEVWAWFEGLPSSVKDKARARLLIVQQVEALEAVQGRGRHMAVQDVARLSGQGARTIWTWFAAIEGVRSDDRLPYLAPRNRAAAPRSRSKGCEPAFFDVIAAAFLRLAGPCFTDCYRAAVKIAASKGWETLPERTMRRRLDANVSRVTQVLAREGVEALQRLYPAQVRDKSAMVAMEAVNADFHKFDVFVRWPAPFGQNEPGLICRPQMVAFQDIYSGRILSWRIDQTPNSTAVQLAAGDMIETYGIPAHVLFDNGREFAAKSITGGAATRFRFKVKAEDPLGLFENLGCKVHWASPYHGQAKPIERAFRDMCSSIAKDVRFDGAYTGNTVMAKPEDYGSRAIDLEVFLKVLSEGIVEHNARQNRRSQVAFKRSFAEVFDESYAAAPIRKATEAQRRLWLLGSDEVTADKLSGAVWFQKNEFWDGWMQGLAGERVTVRFDPADFHAGLHVYAQDGAYLGHAPIRQAVGFFDQDEARLHARARKEWMSAEKRALKALRKFEAADVGRMLDEVAPAMAGPVEAKVVKPVFGKGAKPGRPAAAPDMTPEVAAAQAQLVTDIASRRPAPVAPVEETPRDRYRQALALQARIAAGEPVTRDQRAWLEVYQTLPEFRTEATMHAHFKDAYFG